MGKRLPKKGKEVLELLVGGMDLEFRRSPRGYFRVIGKNSPWTKFHRKTLLYAINLLYKNGFAEVEESPEGLTKVKVTNEGKQFFKKQQSILGGAVKPKEWDKKWRLIFFDVPEEKKKFRDALRYQLQKAGLIEFQRSAFIYPYSCFSEVEALAEELNVKDHMVFVTAETLSNEFKFRKHFGLV